MAKDETVKILVRLPASLVRRLDKVAADSNRTRTKEIQTALEKHIDAQS